jgi:DNA polymerase III delta subunit-like protein
VALETIRDQPHAVDLLGRALTGDRVAHAYAFIGPPGSGRMTTAMAFAGALLCDTGGCGACRNCSAAASRQHPDLHVLVPTPPEKNPKGTPLIRIEALSEMVRQATLRPAMSRRRVLIVDDADRMTEGTPESILKFLEEPAPNTVIILILPHARARTVPATIISRCQIVRFRTRGGVEGAAAVAEAADLLDEIREGGPPALFKRTERMDRERAEGLIDGCWLLCRELLLARAGAPAALLSDAAHAEARAKEAAYWTDDALLAAIEVCRQAREALVYHNVAPRLTIDMMLSRLARRAA